MARVMLVVTGLNRGGAERQVVLLASGLASRGHDVAITSLLPPGPLRRELDAAGIPVRSLAMERGRWSWSAVRRLRMELAGWRTDLVHSHMLHATLICRVALAGDRRVPLVSTAHTIDEGGGWRPIVSRLTHRWSAVDTNVTAAGVRAFERNGSVPAGKMLVVPNGVIVPADGRGLRGLGRAGRFGWLCVARSSKAKGIDILVRAMACSSELRDLSEVMVVGGGELLDAHRRLAGELGLDGAMIFAGEESDVSARYRMADALVLPSRWEGLPMVILEAGSHRLPVVAASVGGVPELLRDGAGILVAPESPETLAAGMMAMIRAGEEGRDRMANLLAHRVASEYGMESVLDRWEEIYHGLLAGRKE